MSIGRLFFGYLVKCLYGMLVARLELQVFSLGRSRSLLKLWVYRTKESERLGAYYAKGMQANLPWLEIYEILVQISEHLSGQVQRAEG